MSQEESMKNCKIIVNIDMIDCEEAVSEAPIVGPNGRVEVVINGADSGKIDRCEQALLQAVHPAVREALGQHLSAWSKKSA
jgi:hypothetical protein